MYAIGLTGGIGMGKSTVAKMLVENGFSHWDADAEVHRIYGWIPTQRAPKAHYKQLRLSMEDEFGDILDHNDSSAIVDRNKIIAIASDPKVLARLSAFLAVHIYIAARDHYLAVRAQKNCVFDVPLLLEGDSDAGLNARLRSMCAHQNQRYDVVVVSCPPEVQRERVLARPGMTQERLDAILARQMSDKDKRALADHVIDTSGTLDEVRAQVDSLCTLLKLQED